MQKEIRRSFLWRTRGGFEEMRRLLKLTLGKGLGTGKMASLLHLDTVVNNFCKYFKQSDFAKNESGRYFQPVY